MSTLHDFKVAALMPIFSTLVVLCFIVYILLYFIHVLSFIFLDAVFRELSDEEKEFLKEKKIISEVQQTKCKQCKIFLSNLHRPLNVLPFYTPQRSPAHILYITCRSVVHFN